MNNHPHGAPSSGVDRSGLDFFDRLVEQQDQEVAGDGMTSPFTDLQLAAYRRGEPIPQVNLNSPAIKEATVRLLKHVREYRELQTRSQAAVNGDEDDGWGEEDD